MENKYINEEMCAECGGRCCKKGGCQYAPTDFEQIKYDYLLSKLNEGYISIVSILIYNEYNGKLVASPRLYVKSRNEGRPIVDLFSLRTRCRALTENGCIYSHEERPSGGLNLIPAKNQQGRCCYPEKDPIEFIKMWEPHQNLLRKLIKGITGKSAEKQLKEDVYNVFLDILNQRFEGVSNDELQEVLSGINELQRAFPEAYENARKEYLSSKRLVLKV